MGYLQSFTSEASAIRAATEAAFEVRALAEKVLAAVDGFEITLMGAGYDETLLAIYHTLCDTIAGEVPTPWTDHPAAIHAFADWNAPTALTHDICPMLSKAVALDEAFEAEMAKRIRPT